MRVKIILLMFIFCGELSSNSFAQSVNIWDITFNFLVENGYLSPDNYSRPTKIKENHIVYPYFIFGGPDGRIDDPDFIVPNHNELDSYSFGSIFRQYYTHLLFVKNGKWRIIDMGKSLLDIIMQCHNLCKDFGLDDNESIYVLTEAIRYYENYKKELSTMGVPIITDSIGVN